MYAVRTENSNVWILCEKEIKMAAKFQNVCPKLTDINNHRFFFWKFIFRFLIPAWNYQEMLAIYIASKKLGTQVVTQTEIQDGGQNSKWLSAMYNCISLFLNYKVDTHVQMYYDEYKEIKCISSKLNENQDGCQIPKCLLKSDRYKLSQGLIWTTVFRFRIRAWKF